MKTFFVLRFVLYNVYIKAVIKMECACKHVSALLKYDTKSRYMLPQRYIKTQPQEYYRKYYIFQANAIYGK